MSDKGLVSRINRLHTEQINGLVLKVMWMGLLFSVLQDIYLYIWFKDISLTLVISNIFVLLVLILPSQVMYKSGFEPKKLGYYNVLAIMTYIFFAVWNYDFLPYNLMFLMFNIIVAAMYFDRMSYLVAILFTIIEMVFFSLYFPNYRPEDNLLLEIGSRIQIVLFISLLSYATLRSSQLLLKNLLEQEVKTMYIAHEIRNPLTTVKGFLQLKNSNSTGYYSELMLNELERANEIINDFLTLTRSPTPQLRKTNLNELINNLFKLVSIQVKEKGVILESSFDFSLPLIEVDPNQIKQVILNLLINAVQAVGEQGIITVETAKDGENIFINVTDNGPGIQEHYMEKIFEPFFTTKGNGTGLGLPVCKNILDNHGAKFNIENHNHKGCKVSIIFKYRENSFKNI